MKNKKIAITMLIIGIISLLFVKVIRNKSVYARDTDIYDVILFFGQSNMQGMMSDKEERFDNKSKEEVENFAKATGIDTDILYNTTRMNYAKIALQPSTVYEYKYLTNSLEEISADTQKIGELLTYNQNTKKLEAHSPGHYGAALESKGTNMIPEFCRTYYERTGHKVVVVMGAVSGQKIQRFLPVDDTDYTESAQAIYLYEGIVEKYKSAISYLQNSGYNIGNKLWVSCQGEANVSDGTSESEYKRLFLKVHNNLKNDLGITRGAIVQTSTVIGGEGRYPNVEVIHQAQEAIIKENNDIILGSAYPYERYVPDQATYETEEYINETYTDDLGNKLNYNEAFNNASYSVCYSDNTIHFTSAALSQIGREAAISFSNAQEISIISTPNKKSYIQNYENLNLEGGKLQVKFYNGTIEEIEMNDPMVNINGFDNTKIGTNTVQVTVRGQTATFDVEIISKQITGIEVTTNPNKTNYARGENFCPVGMVVTATYDDESTEQITDYTVIGGSNLNCLVKKVEIQSNENPEIKTVIPIVVEHDMISVTCTEERKCRVEGCIYKEEALGHCFTNYVSNKDATCTKDGTKTAKCDRCEETNTQTDVGSMLPHTEVIDEEKEPTCTQTGLTQGKHCSECKKVLKVQEIIPKLGHDYKDIVTAPKCFEKGYTTHKCTRCENSYIDTYIEALGHCFTNYASNKDATCTKDGTKTAKCDRCDETNTQTDVGSMLPHTEVIDEGKEPTSTQTGLTQGKHCSECKKVLKVQEIIPKLGHDYKDIVTAPRCLEKGYTTHKCTRCENSYIDTYIEALGHSFTNYKSNKDATCTKDGTKTAKCDRCDETNTQTDVGSMLPHIEVIDEGKEPTCTQTGLTQGKHCSECKKVLKVQEIIPKLGHDYKDIVTAPKCLEKGYTTHKCTRCENSYIDTYIEALGHCFTNYASNKDATCTKDGTKTAKCDRCDETNTQTDIGSILEHNYNNGKCTMCGKKEPRLEITSDKYDIGEFYISKIEPQTTIKEFKEQLQTNSTNIKIYNKENELQEENVKIATGMQVELKFANKAKRFTISVAGDVNGDGKADFKDIVIMNKHRLKKTVLEGEYLMAGDINEDGKVDFKDLVKINRFRLHKITEL